MSKRRRRWNAITSKMVGHIDDRPALPKISREEWVIRCVSRVIGTQRNLVTADDLASDIILDLLNAGGFSWEESEIEAFCRKRAAFMLLRCMGRREQPECEFANNSGEIAPLYDRRSRQAAHQEICYEAMEARALLRAIPNRQREALEILCDGGNPVDVAEELGITPWEAITVIKEARSYIDRVDPAND